MKNILLAAVIIITLAACATKQKEYGPAYGTDFGFKNTKIQHDRYRISYTSRDGYQSRDYALLRAAQISEIEGYSHFKIIDGQSYDNGPSPLVGGGVGIGTGVGGKVRGYADVGIEDVARAIEGSKATETIEIVLLSHGDKNDLSVYDVQSVIKSIQPLTPITAP